MGRREQLQILLEMLLGSRNVYFQPPANVAMKYPCIVYELDTTLTKHAGNKPYLYDKRYQLTIIDPDPDSEIHDKIAALPLCSFSRRFVADNLNHDVFNLYF